MVKLHIDDLEVGMRLGCDLKGANGRFLLPKGVEIEEKHLRILKIWGVNEIDIEGEIEGEGASKANFSPAILERSKELVDDLFALSNTEFPPVIELQRLSLNKTAQRLSQGCPSPLETQTVQETPLVPVEEEPEQFAGPEDLAGAEVELASFPDIYFQIADVLNSPSSTASHVADVVSKDAALSAKLLRLVNSPFYGFPSKVDSITRAVALVGSKELSMLALGVSVVEYFEDVPPELMDMRNFWMHSIACGVFAHILASHMAGLSEERFFLGGLIHDIGRLVILKNAPRCAAITLNIARSKPCLLFEAEQEVIGFDHSAVASNLMRLWQFPESLEEMVTYHHSPGQSPHIVDAAVVHCADIMARSLWTGYKGLFYVPPLNQQAWEALELSPGVLSSVMSQGEHLIQDIFNTFLGEH